MFEVLILESIFTGLRSVTTPVTLFGYQNPSTALVVATKPRPGLVEVGVATTNPHGLGEMADGTVHVLVCEGHVRAEVSVEGVWVPATLRPLSTRRELQARNEGLVPAGTLAGAAIVVFGVGSVGSLMVRHLVQAGVGRVTLIDPDVLAPSNVSRHVLDLADVGRPKVAAMADALWRINPELEVAALQLAVGPDSLPIAVATLAGASLAIIATDSVEANRAAQLACIQAAQVPAIAVGCWDRAEAAEIIVSDTRCRTACYGCLRASLPTATTGRGATEYMLQSDDTPPNVGLGLDVAFIAAVATKVCIGLLTNDQEVGLVDDEHTVLLVSTRPGGVFSVACQVSPVSAERDLDCWLCSHLHEEVDHAK